MSMPARDQRAHGLREERGAAASPRADSVRAAEGGGAEREATSLVFQALPKGNSSASFKDQALRSWEAYARLLRA